MKLIDYFYSNHDRNGIDKWLHYFDIYEAHFNKFVDKKVKILEIGVSNGGSLEMWKQYFGSECQIVGIDIHPGCKQFETDQIKVYIGDQADKNFLEEVISKEGNFDIIIDDGGHFPHQQIISFRTLYKYVNDGGVYLCEDLHTNYMKVYNSGYKHNSTFIELTKNLIDELNAFFSETDDLKPTYFTVNTTGIHIYDSVVVFDKQKRDRPQVMNIGSRKIHG